MITNFKPRLELVESGWFRVAPHVSLRQLLRRYFIFAAIWLVALAIGLCVPRPNYFDSLPFTAWCCAWIAAVLLFWAPLLWLEIFILQRNIQSLEVLLDQGLPLLGQPFGCIVRVNFQRAVRLNFLRAHVVCYAREPAVAESTSYGNEQRITAETTCWDQALGAVNDETMEPGQSLEFRECVVLSDALMASSPPAAPVRHRYVWAVVVQMRMHRIFGARLIFPITIGKPATRFV